MTDRKTLSTVIVNGLSNKACRRPGWRPRVSAAKNGDWLRAKVVKGQRRPAPNANVSWLANSIMSADALNCAENILDNDDIVIY